MAGTCGKMDNKNKGTGIRKKLYIIIFEADTFGGKLFDIILIVAILLSVVVVMLDSVSSIRKSIGPQLYAAEWFFTVLFSIEYIVRLYSSPRPFAYVTSFFGIIDLFAVIPTYLNLFFPGSHYLIVIRVLRVLRIFRVLKLVQFIGEAEYLMKAINASRRKITVFMFFVLTLVTVLGSLMYLVEGEKNGFTSIPVGIYWAIVTLTTVGYGDVSPGTPLGQTLATVIMLTGYSIIAVPTGIVTVELAEAIRNRTKQYYCSNCGKVGHDNDASYCKYCGKRIPLPESG